MIYDSFSPQNGWQSAFKRSASLRRSGNNPFVMDASDVFCVWAPTDFMQMVYIYPTCAQHMINDAQ